MSKLLPAGLLRIVYRSVMYRKLRVTLTGIGIVIAIAVVVALLFIGNGLKSAVSSTLQQFGNDRIVLLPMDVTDPMTAFAANSSFDAKDLQEVRGVPGIEIALPIIQGDSTVAEFRGEKESVALHAQPWDLFRASFAGSQGFSIKEGEWPTNDSAREVIVGSTLAAKTFSRPIHVNDEMVIHGRALRVTGILNEVGERRHDNSVMVSIDLLGKLGQNNDNYTVINIKPEPGADQPKLIDDLTAVLNKRKHLESFTVMPVAKAGEIAAGVIGIIETFLMLIASVAVIIGGIGVMNTMYTSVLERTREIGILKAIGARQSHVIALFMVESATIGLAGGIVGIGLGGIAAQYVAYLARGQGFKYFDAAFNWRTAIIALTVSIIVGAIAGVLPARQAAKQRPANALKYR